LNSRHSLTKRIIEVRVSGRLPTAFETVEFFSVRVFVADGNQVFGRVDLTLAG
jgi:hypothetical protein